ncbi:PIN domain-containing protein [Candidatus Woesearchaeota archaeon]|nr:PIN domain-containing protein [Candidatus Woesearchaeota archaeon]
MSLVFDTSILIELDKKNKSIESELKEYIKSYPTPAQIVFISYFEFYYGLHERNLANKMNSLSFINKFSIITITKNTAHILADIKRTLQKKGLVIPLADLLIAAQVMEHNLILVTKDKDFGKIENLKKIIIE